MNKNIKKISTLALSVSITACGFGQCGCAQHFVPPTPVANRVMPRGPVTPVLFRMAENTPIAPGTPEANRHRDMGLLTPMRPLHFNADTPAVPPTPMANRVRPRGPVTPVLFRMAENTPTAPGTPEANQVIYGTPLSPVSSPNF